MALRAVRNKARKRPPVNPLSARSLKKAKVLAAKLLKCAKDQTAANCTWSTSDRGGLRTMNVEVYCSQLMCCDTITPELEGVRLADVISLLRSYYSHLDKTGKRAFMADRTSVKSEKVDESIELRVRTSHTFTHTLTTHSDSLTQDEDGPVRGGLLGKHMYNYFLEDINLLHSRLIQWNQGHEAALPRPNHEELRSVCGKFFLFACGGHSDTIYQQHARVEQARLGSFDRLSQVALTSAPYASVLDRRHQTPKTDALHAKIRYFIKQSAEGGVILPNARFIVLPWNSVPSCHAAYVRNQESVQGVTWAVSQWTGLQALSRRRPAVPLLPSVEMQTVQTRKALRKFSRYGNRLLGPKDAAKPQSKEIATISTFHRVWLHDVEMAPYIIRRWIPFAKCGTCSDFKLKEKAEKDPQERKNLQRNQDSHLREVEFERRAYYTNQCRAQCAPETYLSLIVDGADQSDQELPHFHERSHTMDSVQKQKLHVYGALAHGRRAYAFTLPAHVRQGHNTTIEVIWRVMEDIVATEGKLPPVFLLQLDNTTKQNKGTYLYAFLYLLVHHGVFDRIIISYLPVGHTHEDIDQMFSRFAIALRQFNAVTRTEMGNVLEDAFFFNELPTIVVHMDTCANISGWIENLTECKTKGTPECMAHRHFRFRKDKTGKTLLQARSSPIVSFLSEPWQGLQGDTVEHDLFPDGVPSFASDALAGLIPPCARPGKPLTLEYYHLVSTSLTDLQRNFGAVVFTDAMKHELLAMVTIYLVFFHLTSLSPPYTHLTT